MGEVRELNEEDIGWNFHYQIVNWDHRYLAINLPLATH